jgi:hypothetical protein
LELQGRRRHQRRPEIPAVRLPDLIDAAFALPYKPPQGGFDFLGSSILAASRRSILFASGFVGLLMLTAWLLWPGIHGPFLFDDVPNLKNLGELNGHPSLRSIGSYLALFNGVPGRPLSALSFVLNDAAWPSEPLGFKLTNLWIHLLNGVLVFGLARCVARAYSTGAAPVRSDAIALACTAIWLLNPIQISAVFLTVQRMAELAGTCMFASLWAYLAIGLRARSSWQALLALIVLGTGSVLAVLCKENGVLTPLLALVLHATLLRPALARLPAPAAWVLRCGVLAAVALLVLAFAWEWSSLTSFASRDYTMWERVMTQGRALVRYVGLIAMPHMASSALYNDDFAISRALLDPATTLPALLAVASTLVVALMLQRRAPLFAFAVLWFLAAHATESTVFPLEMYFEHRNYVPLFGPAFALAATVLRTQGDLRRPLLVGFFAWLLLSAGITRMQAQVWGNEGLLATVWHVEHPTSLRAQQQYASYLADQGRLQEAHAVMANTAGASVSPVDSGLQAITIECVAHRLIDPAEIAASAARLRSDALAPGTAAILARLRLSVQQGDCDRSLPPQAWLYLTQQALDNPRGNGIWRMLLVERAELYLAANRLDAAIHELDVAYSGHGEPRIAFYAAALLATAGRYDEARTWAQRTLGRPWSWKGWLAQTDRQAHEMIQTINQSQADARKQRRAGVSHP